MSNRLWGVNASPIISLANIEHAHLLTDLSEHLIIPLAVEHEILDGSDDDPAKHWISTTGQRWAHDIGPEIIDVPLKKDEKYSVQRLRDRIS